MAAEAAPRPTSEERIRAALWFAERGFGVFSVWSTTPDGTCRCPRGQACESPGKHPVPATGFKAATTDPDRIRVMLSAASEPNWGMLPPEGVFAWDVDGEGIPRLAELETKYGPLPPTLRTNTAHGQHVFLRWPEAHPRPIGQLFGYVTRWGSGRDAGYVVGPRSVHASGAVYAPAGGTYEIATLPETWATAAVGAPVAHDSAITITSGYVLPERIPAGGARHDAIRDYTAHLYDTSRLTIPEMWPLVRDVLAPRFEDALTEPEIRRRFDNVTKDLEKRLGERRHVPTPITRIDPGPGMDMADLLDLNLPPLNWIVPGLIPEGTTVLAAPPKVGKSCLVYQIAVETAFGGDLLGRPVAKGSALYLALEDGKRRGQERALAALAGRRMPRGRLEIRWGARNIGEGLEEDLKAWLDKHDDAVLVALDTLGKVRPQGDSRRNAYDVDVQMLGRLQDIFRDRPVALLIVHHLRKAAADDFVTSVSGTYGITGSADTILTIKRKRLESFGSITVTGRDVADTELAVRFDDQLWTAAPGAVSEMSTKQGEVFETIESLGPIYPKAIADRIGLERTAVQHLVDRLVTKGAVTPTARGYVVSSVTLVTLEDSSLARARVDMSHVTDITLEKSDASDATHAREAGTVDCRSYAAHQSSHRRTSAGWICAICTPEEPA